MLYRLAVRLSKIFFGLFYKTIYEGLENVPKEGPLIICSNHISMLDMFLFGPKISRRIHFMAKQELFKIPLLNIILKKLCAYPVKRGYGDLQAARTTLKLLQEGEAVGIFPEGRRKNKSKIPLKPKSGAILFAKESGSPILPVGIFGNYKIFSKIRVVYGKPYYPVHREEKELSRTDMKRLAEELMEKIYSLDQKKGVSDCTYIC